MRFNSGLRATSSRAVRGSARCESAKMHGFRSSDDEEIERIIRERSTDDNGSRASGADPAPFDEDEAFCGMKTGATNGEWRVPLTRDLVNRGFISISISGRQSCRVDGSPTF